MRFAGRRRIHKRLARAATVSYPRFLLFIINQQVIVGGYSFPYQIYIYSRLSFSEGDPSEELDFVRNGPDRVDIAREDIPEEGGSSTC